MDKKGVSMAVAWVLLLGLSISLAIVVGTWLKNITSDTGEGVVSGAEIDQRCADSVMVISNLSCVDEQIRFKNTGSFNITKAKCLGEDITFNLDGNHLAPGVESIEDFQSVNLNKCFNPSLNNTDVVPFIEIDGVEVPCADKSVRIVC